MRVHLFVGSLFGRVFLTFWMACALLLASLAAVTSLTNARPLSHRWLMHALNLYATTAIDAYEQGSVPRLTEYLSEIYSDSKISATLFKADVNLTTASIPPAALRLRTQASERQRSQYAFKSPWLDVVRQVRHGNVYFFVAQVEPMKMFGNFIDPESGILRIALALLISTTLCGLLARNITRPIRSLQRTAMAIAAGNLAARTAPALGGRSDEIALLAHDFDRMAEPVQLLLGQQKLLLQNISHELRRKTSNGPSTQYKSRP
jgi:two-component system sensor histidine kinase CpxA